MEALDHENKEYFSNRWMYFCKIKYFNLSKKKSEKI